MEACLASKEPLFSLKLVISYKIFFTLELSFDTPRTWMYEQAPQMRVKLGLGGHFGALEAFALESWSRGVCAHTPFLEFAGNKRLDVV